MAVYHVLKDGSTVKDITGHVVKMADAETLYRYLLNRGSRVSKKPNTYLSKNEVRV